MRLPIDQREVLLAGQALEDLQAVWALVEHVLVGQVFDQQTVSLELSYLLLDFEVGLVGLGTID